MKTFLGLALAALLVGTAGAQVHVINANGFSFADSVSGTPNTTITLGTTIQWVNVSGFHLILDGATPSSPGTGGLFNFPLDPGTGPFSYTPCTAGVIQYYCFPHFSFGMTGTITVNPPGVVPPPINGSGEDFTISTLVNGGGCPDQYLTVSSGDLLTTTLESPSATFDGLGPLLLVHPFTTGATPPTGPIGFPELHVNLPGVVIVFNGGVPGPLGPHVLAPGGITLNNLVPPTLIGSSLHMQGIVITPTATNGFFATSDARSITIQ